MTDVYGFLDELDDLGVIVERIGGKIRVDAPQGVLNEAITSRLREHKRHLLEVLETNWAADALKVISEIAGAEHRRDFRDDGFEEKAAMLEYVEGLDREDAEMQAFGLVLFEILRRDLLRETQNEEAG